MSYKILIPIIMRPEPRRLIIKYLAVATKVSLLCLSITIAHAVRVFISTNTYAVNKSLVYTSARSEV